MFRFKLETNHKCIICLYWSPQYISTRLYWVRTRKEKNWKRRGKRNRRKEKKQRAKKRNKEKANEKWEISIFFFLNFDFPERFHTSMKAVASKLRDGKYQFAWMDHAIYHQVSKKTQKVFFCSLFLVFFFSFFFLFLFGFVLLLVRSLYRSFWFSFWIPNFLSKSLSQRSNKKNLHASILPVP